MQDLLDEKILKQKITAALEPKRLTLRPHAKDPLLDLHAMVEQYLAYGHRLEQYIADTAKVIWDLLDEDRALLFEGAQGALLDLDHGTYPFVTSSNPVAAAACIGSGVGPKDIDEIWGIAKAYATRVGSGPFPTELDGDLADDLRERGGEYGTTTGRPRRIGWIDLVALRYAARINSLTALVITKLDVLSGFERIRLCTAYRSSEGAELNHFPYHQSVLHKATPHYVDCDGWEEDISAARTLDELPAAARSYLETIATYVGVPVVLVGVGPGRDQIVWADRTADVADPVSAA
jgi:adenylosuccinate synthase